MYITRRERFSTSHKLRNNNLSEKENEEIFGKCYNLHGHNYELFITVTGKINPKTGFVIDLKNLKHIVQVKIIQKLDHKDMNNVDFMKNLVCSTENLCVKIWQELEAPIKELGAKIYKIKINETENNSFEYYGE